jgi:hypothetical protein
MNITVWQGDRTHPGLGFLKNMLENAIDRSPKMTRALMDCDISIGPPTRDPRFATPLHAISTPNYVGAAMQGKPGSPFVGDMIASQELITLSKAKPKEVILMPYWNEAKGKYDMIARRARDVMRGMVMDASVMDAAPDLMLTQQLSPWNVSWYEKLFKKPLLYSHALEAAEIFTGTNPWAEAMNIQLADYAGFGLFEHSGGIDNTLDQPLNVSSFLMSSLIFNITASYTLTLEELKRSEESGSPFGQQLITTKEEYAAYVIKIITDYLVIYGDSTTAILGLLQVPSSITSYGGTSLNGIAVGASATKGADMYAALIGIVEPYLTANWNKLDEVILMLSPKAHNLLRSYPYSAVYNPESAVQAWIDNFAAGMGKEGKAPTFRIVSEPLLAATITTGTTGLFTNPFNAQTYDYAILCSPRIKGGPEETTQPLLLAGMPLKDFSYPVIPGGYNSTYKFLRRYAGLFAPVPSTVVAFSGFGQKSTST